MVDAGEWAAIEHLVDRLKESYPEVPPDTIMTVVHHNHARFDGRPIRDFVPHNHARFDGRPIRDFVPLFVERAAKRQLAKVGA